MNGIENARFDLAEAAASVETALEVVGSLARDGSADGEALADTAARLSILREELESLAHRLDEVRRRERSAATVSHLPT